MQQKPFICPWVVHYISLIPFQVEFFRHPWTVGSCEHDDEPLGSTREGGFLNLLRDYKRRKNNSLVQSRLIGTL